METKKTPDQHWSGVASIGGFMMYIAAFKENLWWGLACILIAPAIIVFLVMHWDKAKRGFLIWLVGSVVLGIGCNLIF